MPYNKNSNNCWQRVAVRADRIYNGARREQTITRTLALENFTPPAPAAPIAYINGGFTGEATVTAVAVAAVAGSQKSRLTVDYSIPVTINYTDAGGNYGRAAALLGDTVDLLLTMPTCPYRVEVETVYASRIGTIEGNTAVVTGCLITIVRIIVKCDLVVSGVCGITYPLASLTEESACAGLFERLNN